MRKILLPGIHMTGLDFYKSGDIKVTTSRNPSVADLSAEYVIGLSLGSLVILKNIHKISDKIILINPPLPKRNIFIWFARWMRYLMTEGIFLEKQHFTKNPIKFFWEIIVAIKLLNIDFDPILESFPKERLTVIRGKDDKFCCDEQSAHYLKSKGIKIIDANGEHNWSEDIETEMNKLFNL